MKRKWNRPRKLGAIEVNEQIGLINRCKLTSMQRLRILQRLFNEVLYRQMASLSDTYEDMRVWGSPSECFGGVEASFEKSFRKTIEFWTLALFSDDTTRDAEIYGAHYMAMCRVPGYYLKGFKVAPFAEIIGYLKFNMPDGFVKFVVESEEHMVITKSDWNSIKKNLQQLSRTEG